ncbi:MAG: MaoC family dehydratase N-terminal domain-containing protein [Myxococcales bacterium]|nr:MAG: MaoC family dehydratase N-terminal domain-containing protein [Myxococcales bacterium]
MAINPEALGKTTEALKYTYRWQDVVLYALGIGAKVDELDYLYEARGPKVLPSFIVVPAYQAAGALFQGIGGNLEGVVHGAQSITMHKALPPSGTLTTTGKVTGLYDLKRMAQAYFTTETVDESGELVAETEWSIIYRMDGGFGGEAPPRRPQIRPPEREADFVFKEATSKEQALLYRLNGDYNPLHADPELGEKVGFGGPILHGLCTYGHVARAVIKEVCAGDASKLKQFSGQFRKPVWPGDTLITEGWKEDGTIILRVSCEERPGEVVFGNAFALLH